MGSEIALPIRLADRILEILMSPDEKEKKAAETALEKTEVDKHVSAP